MPDLRDLAPPISHEGDPVALSYDSTVPRHLVHRAAVAEVLLTDWQQTDKQRFMLAAQWPRGHSLYGSRAGRFDSLLIAETTRQAGILLAHAAFSVPAGWSFLMQRLSFDCVPERLCSVHGPLDLVVAVEVHELVRQGHAIGGMRIEATLWHDGDQLGRGSGSLRCVRPEVYQRLRSGGRNQAADTPATVAPTAPSLVGRCRPADVVVGTPDAAGARPLRVPRDHPVFFDHPLDHVPGMLVFEAMGQTGRALLDLPEASARAADMVFATFIELDRECVIVPGLVGKTPHGTVVHGRFVQGGRDVAQGRMTLSR